jgi:hypothetical protein
MRAGHSPPTGRPSFALASPVAIRLFGLVVKEDLLGRERQIDAVCEQGTLDSGQDLIARIHCL